MKITRVLAYRVDLPLHEGSYRWSGGKSVSVFDSTIVAVETDECSLCDVRVGRTGTAHGRCGDAYGQRSKPHGGCQTGK